jgi:uracil-DNA glycosylase
MQINKMIGCRQFPCTDVKHDCFVVPGIDIDPDKVSLIMISEAAPAELTDYYYSDNNSLFERTTVQAFQDAGANIFSVNDILNLGVYLTTAVKCGKTGYGIATGTVKECSFLLEKELALFPKAKIFMLMGDIAIKAVNEIARRTGKNRVIPAGSTYKIRNAEYWFQNKRVFPSYLQAGPSFFIEKSKRKMIADDIGKALQLLK